jgi:hypothetical protein
VIKTAKGMQKTDSGGFRGVHHVKGLWMRHGGKGRSKQKEEREMAFHAVCLTALLVLGRAENQPFRQGIAFH